MNAFAQMMMICCEDVSGGCIYCRRSCLRHVMHSRYFSLDIIKASLYSPSFIALDVPNAS